MGVVGGDTAGGGGGRIKGMVVAVLMGGACWPLRLMPPLQLILASAILVWMDTVPSLLTLVRGGGLAVFTLTGGRGWGTWCCMNWWCACGGL